ncbi:MAG TPA: RNA polymerase sigma factor [Chthonomonadales bacterium]|nr:RNA polymerase sigma factor [Chthonomonadales bacterium]
MQRQLWGAKYVICKEGDRHVAARRCDPEAYNESPLEKRLVARFQAGEPEALGALFDLHVDHVFAFACHLVGNRADAEEITSEAFLRAFEKAASFRGDCPIRGWLFGITRNLCADRMRQPRLLLLDPDHVAPGISDGISAAADTRVIVQDALSRLPEDQRMLLLLCDVEQWEAREAAAMMGKSLDSAKSLLYRARRALRKRLAETWGDQEMMDA